MVQPVAMAKADPMTVPKADPMAEAQSYPMAVAQTDVTGGGLGLAPRSGRGAGGQQEHSLCGGKGVSCGYWKACPGMFH